MFEISDTFGYESDLKSTGIERFDVIGIKPFQRRAPNAVFRLIESRILTILRPAGTITIYKPGYQINRTMHG